MIFNGFFKAEGKQNFRTLNQSSRSKICNHGTKWRTETRGARGLQSKHCQIKNAIIYIVLGWREGQAKIG